MTMTVLNCNNMRALRLVTALTALENIYHRSMTGACFALEGKAYAGLPDEEADLLWLLIDTAAREARELQAELEAVPEDVE